MVNNIITNKQTPQNITSAYASPFIVQKALYRYFYWADISHVWRILANLYFSNSLIKNSEQMYYVFIFYLNTFCGHRIYTDTRHPSINKKKTLYLFSNNVYDLFFDYFFKQILLEEQSSFTIQSKKEGD